MIEAVLDSSAVLAHIFGEPGGDESVSRFADGVVSAVNLTEIVTRLVDAGWTDLAIDAEQQTWAFAVEPFDVSLAVEAGGLRRATRHRGLSLGDRACLALARRLGVPLYTADRSWGDLDVGVDIRVVR